MATELCVGVSGVLTLDAGAVPESFRLALVDALTAPKVKGSPALHLIDTTPDQITIPRGAINLLRHLADRHAIPLRWMSRVVGADMKPNKPTAGLGIKLRPYQSKAVEQVIAKVQCLLQLPCGGGKTTIGAAVAVTLGLPALVVVPTIDILDQWVETLKRCGAERVLLLGRKGYHPPRPGEVAVCTADSLRSATGQELLHSVAVLVVDECHRAPSATWRTLVEDCPARYRIGLTATPERSDRNEWALPYLFGEVVIPATLSDLFELGYLQAPKIIPVASGWTCSPEFTPLSTECPKCGTEGPELPPSVLRGGKTRCRASSRVKGVRVSCGAVLTMEAWTGRTGQFNWTGARHECVNDEGRNEVIVRCAAMMASLKRSTLVIVSEVQQAKRLAAACAALGHVTDVLHGDLAKGKRKKVVERFRAGSVAVVFATKVADEGLDIPGMDCILIADPGKASGKLMQRTGRPLRPGGAPPVILDLVDAGGVYQNQWGTRSFIYVHAYGKRAFMSWRPVPVDELEDVVKRTERVPSAG